MNFLKKICVTLALVLGATNLFAIELESQFDLSAGYRNDEISTHNTIDVPEFGLLRDHLELENMDIGEIGFNFRLTMPECECSCNFSFLRNFYLDGYANWGWSGKDHFGRIISTEDTEGVVTGYSFSHGNLKARTEDYQIGLAYVVWNDDCWAASFRGGYAHDFQHVKLHGTHVDGSRLSSSSVFKQRWQGPWLGAEIFYEACGSLINAGYQYHFADYHATFSTPTLVTTLGPDLSSVRRSHGAYGNIGYINAKYKICEGWQAGLGFIYKHYRARHAHLHPKGETFVEAGFPEGTTSSAAAKWITYSITAEIGYAF